MARRPREAFGQISYTVSRLRASPDQIVRARGPGEIDDLVLPLGADDDQTRGWVADSNLDDKAATADAPRFNPGDPPAIEARSEAEREKSAGTAKPSRRRLVRRVRSQQLDFGRAVGKGDVAGGHNNRAGFPGCRPGEQRAHPAEV